MRRKCEQLSHRQRRQTPLPFCRYLLARVQAMFPEAQRVAVLWCCPWSLYGQLYPAVQTWTARNNARRYPGPFPVICHPPCGPWGKFSWKSRESKEHGILAMEFVHRWGGVVEQPLGSQLFKLHGRGGTVEKVNQGDYGHQAQKATLLYFATGNELAPAPLSRPGA